MWTLLILACTTPSSDGVAPMLSGDGFFDRPWPADDRTVDGHPDLAGFPGEGVDLVDRYLAAIDTVDGFGTNSPLYVRFEGPIDTAVLPDAEASVGRDSAVWLVDVDPSSPAHGARVPLQFEFTEGATTFQPENLLAIAPVFGFPLRPHTRYALVLRPPLALPGGMPDGWTTDPAWRDLVDTLLLQEVDTAEVAAATVFTTQSPTAELAAIAREIHDGLQRPGFDPDVVEVARQGGYVLYQGHVTVPIWQAGERPYRDEGGAFMFNADGRPLVQAWERVRFSLTVPTSAAPAGGWPLVLYSHGTGGDDRTFCYSGNTDEEGTVMASQGIAMIGIAQPLHGDRGTPDTNVEMDSFNYFNPDAGRTNFRQGAADQIYLARVLHDGLVLQAPDVTLRFDPAHLAFFGHSQGGLVGALGAPFYAGDVVAAGFSGTGGGLSMTVVLRKDPFDIAEVLASALGFTDDEVVDTFHPAVGLVQMYSEVTDPLNYGAWWFAQDGGFGGAPVPILLTEGLLDEATPSVTTEALAAAARIPIVGAAATDPDALRLRGLSPVTLPAAGNATDWRGGAITAGLGQYPDDDHYAIYDNRDARRLYRNFLATALGGGAELSE